MKKIKRLLCLAAAVVMIVSIAAMTSCEEKIVIPNDKYIEFPIEKSVTLTWWYGYDDTYYTGDFEKLEDHPFMKEMKEKSNVNIEFVLPTTNNPGSELNTHIAAGDMADMVSHNWYTPSYEGNSIDAVVDEEIYQPLNDFVDMQMPNFNALREEYSVIDKIIVTSQNNILWIPRLNDTFGVDSSMDEYYYHPINTGGLVVRKDYLDEIQFISEDGVSHYPVTINDWDNMLDAFSKMLGLEAPLGLFTSFGWCTFTADVFLSSWNVKVETYREIETGNAAYGAVSDGFYEYLKLIRRWREEGKLAEVNFTNELKVQQGYLGAWYGNADEIVNLKALSTDPNFELIGVPDPVQNVGDKIVMRDSYRPLGCASLDCVFINYECENGPLACRWLDEFFTEETYMRTSYGIEGEDYTVDADGKVQFTDKVLNNKDGVRYGIYQAAFMESFWRDPRVIVNYAYNSEQLAAIEQWSKSTLEFSYIDRLCLSYTEAEQAILSTTGGIGGAVAGGSMGIFRGDTPLEDWSVYVESVRNAGLDEYIEVMQSAWDRFLAN